MAPLDSCKTTKPEILLTADTSLSDLGRNRGFRHLIYIEQLFQRGYISYIFLLFLTSEPKHLKRPMSLRRLHVGLRDWNVFTNSMEAFLRKLRLNIFLEK